MLLHSILTKQALLAHTVAQFGETVWVHFFGPPGKFHSRHGYMQLIRAHHGKRAVEL